MSGHNNFQIVPSRWQWHQFKDRVHFFLMLGLIPCGLVVFLSNVFIGPAQLTELPKDRIPNEWEYHRVPITKFIKNY